MSDQERSIRLMLSYDENSDGAVTKEELDAGLKRQFAVCDVNGDGHLDAKETQDENDRRWKANGTLASPLIDWNQDGVISFEEFATTARSVFAELDKDKDGRLSADELRLPRRPAGRGPGGGEAGRGRGGRSGGPTGGAEGRG